MLHEDVSRPLYDPSAEEAMSCAPSQELDATGSTAIAKSNNGGDTRLHFYQREG